MKFENISYCGALEVLNGKVVRKKVTVENQERCSRRRVDDHTGWKGENLVMRGMIFKCQLFPSFVYCPYPSALHIFQASKQVVSQLSHFQLATGVEMTTVIQIACPHTFVNFEGSRCLMSKFHFQFRSWPFIKVDGHGLMMNLFDQRLINPAFDFVTQMARFDCSFLL